MFYKHTTKRKRDERKLLSNFLIDLSHFKPTIKVYLLLNFYGVIMSKFSSCIFFFVIMTFLYSSNSSIMGDFSSISSLTHSEVYSEAKQESEFVEVIPYILLMEEAQKIFDSDSYLWKDEYFKNIRSKLLSDIGVTELQNISKELEYAIYEIFPYIEHIRDIEDTCHAPEIMRAYFKNQALLALNTICLEKIKGGKAVLSTPKADE
jgi:hypothetical protein